MSTPIIADPRHWKITWPDLSVSYWPASLWGAAQIADLKHTHPTRRPRLVKAVPASYPHTLRGQPDEETAAR